MLYFNLGPKESNKNRNNRKTTDLCQNTKFSIQEIGAPKKESMKKQKRTQSTRPRWNHALGLMIYEAETPQIYEAQNMLQCFKAKDFMRLQPRTSNYEAWGPKKTKEKIDLSMNPKAQTIFETSRPNIHEP